MKKTFYLFAFITASGSMLLAQPTLQMNVVPEVGDFIYWARADSSTAQPGSPGANQTWDFSDLSSSTPSTRYEYFTPANTPYANEFPTATLATKHDDASNTPSPAIYTYFQKGENQLLLLGSRRVSLRGVYPDPDVQIQYPLNYGENYEDTYYRTLTNLTVPDYPGHLTGTRMVEYDAYGTLITPLDTFHNTMRIRTTVVQVDSTTHYYGHQNIIYKSSTTYDWIVPYQPGPLVSISYANITSIYRVPNFGDLIDVSPKIKTVYYISAGSVSALSTPKTLEGLSTLSIGPNPTTDQLTLRFNIERAALLQIRLTDPSGRTLRMQKLNAGMGKNMETLFVGDLPTGAYFLSLTDGRGIKTVAWQKI